MGIVVGLLAGCNEAPASVQTDITETQPCDDIAKGSPTGHSPPPFLPFDSAPRAELTASPRKVFAHYFPPYPLNFSNVAPGADYYERQYLQPEGEKGRFLRKGGLLRQKPIARPPIPTYEPFRKADIRHEVDLAAMIGLDGFAVDILSLSGHNWNQVVMLLDVAAEQHPDFRILLMPDMNAELKRRPSAFVPLIQSLAKKPAAFRLPDGRLVLAPYMAQNQSPTWWAARKAELSQLGIEIALVPVFHNWRKELKRFQDELPNTYKDVLYGVSDWGVRSKKGVQHMAAAAADLHQQDLIWMSPVSPQDVRPKSSIFTESSNSGAYRAQWESAIQTQADWVHVISWNDYSETTEIAPSTGTGHVFYDLTAYYVNAFKLGPPTLTRDVLYGIYRPQLYQSDLAKGYRFDAMKPVGSTPPENQIELLSFLSEPGLVGIEQNGKKQQQKVGAGVSSFRVEMQNGTPAFELQRDNKTVLEMKGRVAIETPGKDTVPNLMNQGAGSSRAHLREDTQPVSWPWRYKNFDERIVLRTTFNASPFERRTNAWPVEYRDESAVSSAGFGFSFAPLTVRAAHRIVFDIRFETADQAPALLNLSLMEAAGTMVPIGSLFGDKQHCKSAGAGAENALYMKPRVWYRGVVELEQVSPGNLRGRLIMQAAQGNQKAIIHFSESRTIQPLSGVLFELGSVPGNTGTVNVDNVSLEQM